MYLQEIPDNAKTTTLIKIKYDCCGKEHILKFKDADKNFKKNGQKHICRSCGLKTNNPASRPEVQAKMKKTCLEKYGTEMPLNSKENIATRVEQMFGTETAVQEIVAKRRKTSQQKYGTDHPMQNEEVKARQQAVLEKKYGSHVPLQNADIKAKMQKTVQDKYGVTNVAMIPEVRAKMAKTMYENYGVEHYNQLPEMKDYLRENCAEWLKESWESGGPNKGVPRPEEWNQKQRETVMELIDHGKWDAGPKHSIKGKYQSKKCRRQLPMFRSSYELKVHWHLDNNEEVEWYDYEPFRISYFDTEGEKRYYVIDFVVKYKDGLKAIEVKNDYNKIRFQECGKDAAFRLECHDLNLVIWANKEVEELGLDLNVLLKSTLVEIF